MRRIAAMLGVLTLLSGIGQPVFADDTDDVFFIAMRAPAIELVPRYISVSPDETDTVTAPISGCDGQTYYATPDDATVIAAALANGNIVELETGDTGTPPQNAAVVCIIQTGS